jgi:hypothetical protein
MKISSSTEAHLSRISFVSAGVLVKVDPNGLLYDLHESIYIFER